MKKVIAICSAVLLGTALFAFVGCEKGGSSSGLGGGPGTQAEAGAKQAYGLGAVTTAQLLSMQTAASPAAPLSASTQTEQPEQVGDALRDEVSRFDEYFYMLDTFLDENRVSAEVTVNDNEAYAFDYRLTVKGVLPDGSAVTHTMYYTETRLGAHEEQEEDEYERTETYALEGVLELNGVTYEMRGCRTWEIEAERGEEETGGSLWIMAVDPADPERYVRMDLETEQEQEAGENETETEYVYSVYSGGRLTERTSVSFETEDERGERETEYELSVLKDGRRSSFAVERAEYKNGATVIGVQYTAADGTRGRFVVTQTAEGRVYTFSDDSRLEFDDRDD